MFTTSGRLVRFVAACLVVLVSAACRGVEGGEDQLRIKSLTIFPVTMMGQQHRNVGEALGLVVESGGFRGIKIPEAVFRPGDDSDFDRIANSFGKFITRSPIETEYALYCEFQGTPKEGVQGIRGVVVDKAGAVVWKDVQTPEDAEFKRTKPSNPMACCVFASQRLRPLLVMASAEELAEEGEMARLWRRKSGTPDKKELEAMKVRQGMMREAGGQLDVVVYPVRTGSKVDRDGAEHLASLLNERKLCQAKVANEPLWFEVKPDSNEQRVLWDMAKAFQSNLRKKKPAADYALYADYMISPRGDRVGAVHFVVCDGKGDFVIVDFQNDHHRDFEAISPKSLKDCNRLAATRLAGYLK